MQQYTLKNNVRDAGSCAAAGDWAHQLMMPAQTLGHSDSFDASGDCVSDPAEQCSQAAQSV